MDLSLSAAEETFRQEVRAFFQRETTPELAAEMQSGLGFGPISWRFLRRLGERGWLAPSLPIEYGGIAATYLQRHILMQEMFYFAPEAFMLMGVQIVAPILMHCGTESQKNEYLPRIARGEIEFALGYTEPGAGSDLASIDTRATDEGDHFVITGQKTFNTACHFAQYHWLCARSRVTVPKHRGLSLFIVPLDSPGITISPLWTMSGERTNHVFYDQVHVPKANLVGEKNRGFYHMAEALEHERLFPTAHLQRALDDLVAYAKQTKRNGRTLAENPIVRQAIGEMAVEVEVAHWLGYRIAWLLDSDKLNAAEASALKLFVSELEQRLAREALRVMGVFGQLEPGAKYAPAGGWLEHWYLASARRTIVAGSSEIQRNIIAQRGMGLPRG